MLLLALGQRKTAGARRGSSSQGDLMKSRPTVMLISGQLLTADLWTPQIPAYAGDFDLRFADHTRGDTIAEMAESCLAEAPDNFHIVAHAMGGFIAFEVLRRASDRVESLALLATLASADGPAQTARREGYARLVESGRFTEVVEERMPVLVHPARREDAPLLATVRKMAMETGADRFLIQQRAIMSRIDSRPGLKDISCPTLLVWGRQDGITTETHQAEMLAAIPKGHLRNRRGLRTSTHAGTTFDDQPPAQQLARRARVSQAKPSSLRTIAAPSTIALSLAKASERLWYFIPQSGATMIRPGSAWARAPRMRSATISALSA